MRKPVLVSAEDEEVILNGYKQIPSLEKIYKETGFTPKIIKKILAKNNIEFIKRGTVTPEIRSEMVRLYMEEKLSTWQIGKRLGFLNVCTMNNLKKAGIVLRNRSEAAKTYSVDQNYFEKIDSHDKAYILGIIWADGNMSKDSFTLALKESDRSLLEKISLKIKSTGPLNFRKSGKDNWSNMIALRVHDKFFCQHLKNLGIVERKTSKLEFPKFLDKIYYFSFIRGLMDGDGCISYGFKKNKLLTVSASLAGSEFVTNDIKNILLDIGISSHRRKACKGNGWMTTTSATQALKFMNFIYQNNGDLFLARKYEKFLFIINWINNNKDRKRKEALIELEKSLEIIKQNAQKENCITN